MKKVAVVASRHWKALAGINLFVLLATLGWVITAPKVWTATAQLILPGNSGGSLNVDLGTLGSYRNTDPSFSNQVNPLKTQQAILSSDALLEEAWASDPEHNQFSKPRNYGSFFSVTLPEQTLVMLLSVSGSSPEIAKRRTIVMLNAYQSRLNELRQANNTVREGFSQKQLDQAQKRLNKAQDELTQFRQSTGLVNNEEQTKGIVETINTLSAAQAQTEALAQSSISKANSLAARLGMTPAEAIQALALDQNEDYKSLRSKLTQAEVNLGVVRSTFTERTAQVQKAIADRDTSRRQLEQFTKEAVGRVKADPGVTSGAEGRVPLIQQLISSESEAIGQQQQAAQLQSQIEQRRAVLNTLPPKQARLLELQRQVDVSEGVYKGLVAQVQQSNLDTFNSYPNVQVLNAPTVDLKPSSPKTTVVVINALLASIIGSIALVLLLEARNPLLSPKDLQSFKFPLVARIPRRRHLEMEWNLSTESGVEFQRLASAISLQPLQGRRLLITSAMTGEGKTTITLQLATALSDLGFQVLVVDADFRQAELSRRLGYVPGSSTEEQRVHLQQNLDLLPTRPKQGRIVNLVSRGQFEQYLAAAEATPTYDYVLVDSAPVSLAGETALMATIVPNVLFVVRPGVSARNVVNDSLEQLTQHRAKVFGLVINGVEAQSGSYADLSDAALVSS